MDGNKHIMKNLTFVLSLGALTLVSCKEIKDIGPRGSQEAPETVTVTKVVNDYGRSIIYYNLPDDINVHYVKAVYTPRPGETTEVNASSLTDSLILEGFKEAGEYTVDLFTVSFGNTRSAPVAASVSPMTPPYQLSVERLKCTACFGGLTVAFDNPTKANLDIIVSKKTEEGTWKQVETKYLNAQDARFSVRGQDPVPSEFKVTIKDRWGNSCETEEINLTPLYEQELDKAKMSGLMLAGDATIHPNIPKGVPAVYDGDIPKSFNEDWVGGCYHTAVGVPIPSVFSIDMGEVCHFSRMIWYPRHIMKAGHPRIMEIYGATELNPDATRELFDADGVWTLTGQCWPHSNPNGLTETTPILWWIP